MEAPPQSLRDAVRSRVDEMPVVHPERLPSQRPGGGLAPRQESLPVLEAFQDFLDYERRRARRRLVAVMLTFTLLIVGLLAGAVVFGLYAFKRFDGQLATYAETLRTQQNRTQTGFDAIEAEARTLRGTLLEGRAALDLMRDGAVSNDALYRAEIARLQELVALLDLRQAELQADLLSRMPPPPPEPESASERPLPPRGDTLGVTLNLPDGRTVPWQIPLAAVPASPIRE
jgi:cell division protein FtsB